MANLNLYDITTEFKALEEMLQLDGGELTEDHEQLQTLVSDLIVNKTDGMVNFVQKLKDEQELAAAHIKRLQEFKKTRQNAVDRLSGYVIQCLDRVEKKKVEGKLGSISTRKPIESVDVYDENKIPAEYTKVKVELDKTKISKALKDGEEVPGAALKAGKKSVQFKLKSVK